MKTARYNEKWDSYSVIVYAIEFKVNKLNDSRIRIDWPVTVNSPKNTFNRKQMAILIQPVLLRLGITMDGLWPFRSFCLSGNITKAGIKDKLYRIIDLYKAVGFINYEGERR
jgi:hypothetical protein